MRNSKHDDLVQKVKLIDANPMYARVQFPGGRESNVSLRDLAPCPNEANETGIEPAHAPTDRVSGQPPNNQQTTSTPQTPPPATGLTSSYKSREGRQREDLDPDKFTSSNKSHLGRQPEHYPSLPSSSVEVNPAKVSNVSNYGPLEECTQPLVEINPPLEVSNTVPDVTLQYPVVGSQDDNTSDQLIPQIRRSSRTNRGVPPKRLGHDTYVSSVRGLGGGE